MFFGIMKFFTKLLTTKEDHSLHGEYSKYVAFSYPSNHTYKIINGKLIPRFKLASRYKKIRQFFPEQMASLAEIGCSKGFFVFAASLLPACQRSLGIDITDYDIKVCRWVKENLQNTRTHFEKMQLHELANRIDEFGGPFQTILLLNTYQYLYFGSDRFPDCYLDHDAIFKNLRKICGQRIIFNNRIDLTDCQNIRSIDHSGAHSQNYSEQKMLAAASKYFTITHHGTYGRYPLLTMDIK